MISSGASVTLSAEPPTLGASAGPEAATDPPATGQLVGTPGSEGATGSGAEGHGAGGPTAAAGSQRLFSNSAAGKKRGETLEPLSSLFFGGAYVGGHDESSTAWAQKNSPLSFFVSLCERACVCVCARA